MIRHSESLCELAPALAKAQAAMKAAVRDAVQPQFKSPYCTLSSITDAVRKPLADHGLCVIQGPSAGEGTARVMTMILHSSAQWIAAELALPVGERATPQAIGSAITYARRYGLAALLGVVADEDDDATAAEASAKASPAAMVRRTATPAAAQENEPPSRGTTRAAANAMSDEVRKAASTQADEFEWKGKITDITQRSDKNERGPWTLTRVSLGNKTASTFDKKLGDSADALRKLGADVVVRVKPGRNANTFELLAVEEDLPL